MQAVWGMIFLVWTTMSVAEILDDPTRPPGHAKPTIGSSKKVIKQWWVNAIKIDEQNRLAIVNGMTVKEGNWVGNAYVVSILPDKVKLKNNEGEFFVRLVKQQVKKLPVSRINKKQEKTVIQ